MEYEKIKQLMNDMGNSKLTSIDIDFPDGTKISMKKESTKEIQVIQKSEQLNENEKQIEVAEKEKLQDEEIVKSPMVGTFYSKPSPNANSYVEIGQKVKKGDVLCIVEAMKLMNEIESEFDGEITEILVQDGEAVEYGKPLFKIKSIIPQREPFLMIDEIEEYIPGESAICYKDVKEEEWYFKGHFPGNPIMPGVLITESLAQAGAIAILSKEENKGKNALFGGINKMKFKKQVVPGDRLKLEVKIIKQKSSIGIGEAIATVNGEIVAKGELTFAVV